MPPWTPTLSPIFSEIQTLRHPPDQRTHGLLRSPPWACPRSLHIAHGRDSEGNKRFKTRKKAEEYVTQVITLGQLPLLSPDVVIYTDGSASLTSGTAGWGVFAHRSDNSETSLWGPVITDTAEFNWIGAFRPTNNTGEISAIYHAFK